jgi:endonuclease/exonuclease/phosphatase family metal-dependent hydrolase
MRIKQLGSGFFLLLLLWSILPQGFAAPEPDATDGKYIKVASWNIRIFSNSRTDEELRSICSVAKSFDFFAVMELRDEMVLWRMIEMLEREFGRSYSYELSPPVGGTSELATEEERYHELYAFVYDPKLIKCIGKGQLYKDSAFFRYPYYATFRAGSFDFTAIVIHVIWGKTVEGRRREINRLSHVFQDLQDRDPHENDVLLMGDFNRNPDDYLAWGPLYSHSSMVNLFNLPTKSMILDTNLYDNILFQTSYVKEYTLDKGIVYFDETDFGNDDEAASKAVSDHRPVWALFRTDGTDDD